MLDPVEEGDQAQVSGRVGAVVETPLYQGPFDLLLHLILSEEVDLYELSLGTIVDSYLAELARMTECDLDVATEFLLIAATLVELKCRRLLPVDSNVDLDEEFALWEERDMLLSRLLECKTFKDAALVLYELMDAAANIWPRSAGLEEHFLDLSPDLLEGVEPADIHKAFMKAMRPRPAEAVQLVHVTQIKASVTDAIHELMDKLPRAGRLSFRSMTGHLNEPIEIVVRFLAVLELFKQGVVELDQAANFGDLSVEWIGNDGDREMVLTGVDVYEG